MLGRCRSGLPHRSSVQSASLEVARKVRWTKTPKLSQWRYKSAQASASMAKITMLDQTYLRCPSTAMQSPTRWNPRTRRKDQHLTTARASGISALPAIIAAVCTTITFLAIAVICTIIVLRPLFKRLESLAAAAEAAAREMEKASIEFTLASNMLNNDLPTTLESMERASLEFEELGQSLNGLTGGLRKKPAAGKGAKGHGKGEPPPAPPDGKPVGVAVYEMNPVEAIQAGTINSIRRVAQDVSSLTAALTPAMVAWRKRLGFITERFEAASKDGNLKQLPTAAAEGGKEAKAGGIPPVDLPALNSASVAASNGSAVADLPARAAGNPVAEISEAEKLGGQQDFVAPEAQVDAGEAAKELAKAAQEVARVSRSSVDEDEEATPAARRGANLLERAAEAAHTLTEEAQKAAEAEDRFSKLEQAFPGDFSMLRDGMPASSSDSELQRQQALDEELKERRMAAQAVYSALANAEEAASAAAAASGALEIALQKVEQDAKGSWWGGWNGTAARSADSKTPERTPGSEVQEFDGMAYLSSPFIAARRTVDSASDEGDVTPDESSPAEKSVPTPRS